jgi:hypothetical protein
MAHVPMGSPANRGNLPCLCCLQIYFCMRSGFYEEAKAVARSSPASKDFSPKVTPLHMGLQTDERGLQSWIH